MDYINKFLGNSASTTEFSEMYLANPTGMRGIYKVGKGYYIRYQPSNDAPSTVKDESGSRRRATFYKKADTTAVLETNHFLWEYHDFQNWKEQFVSPHELKSPGDIVPLNRNYLFEGI